MHCRLKEMQEDFGSNGWHNGESEKEGVADYSMLQKAQAFNSEGTSATPVSPSLHFLLPSSYPIYLNEKQHFQGVFHSLEMS